MELLGPLFAKFVAESALSKQAIARAAGFDASMIRKITAGTRGIRIDNAAAWCVALRLNKADTLRLTKAVHLSQASAELRGWIADLERRSGMSL